VKGKLLIIADFVANSGEEQSKDVFVGGYDEKIIVFWGRDGMYSCPINRGGQGFLEFSSHKTLTKDTIEKDLTLPIRLFNVNTTKYSIDYLVRNSDFGTGESKQAAHYDMTAGTLSEVNKETVYSVISLQAVATFEVFAKVESVQDNAIVISGNMVSRLQKAGIDELTLIKEGNEEKTIADLVNGCSVRIVYSKFYSNYDPSTAFVDLFEILPQEVI
jgi:hypothetical protein